MVNEFEKLSLIDIGLNLGHARFLDDWKEVVARAEEVGVGGFVLTGTSVSGSLHCAELAAQMDQGKAFYTVGVHPHYSSSFGVQDIAQMRTMLSAPQAVAVGETGLDYDRNLSPKTDQLRVFRSQVELACEVNKPLFLHERDAQGDLLRVLDGFGEDLPRCVVHCFTGGPQAVERYLERGYYIGVTGWLGQKNRNASLLEALPLIPRDRLMLETDAPFLLPPGYKSARKGRNEPAALVEVARLVGEVLSLSVERVASDAYESTVRFFGIPPEVALLS